MTRQLIMLPYFPGFYDNLLSAEFDIAEDTELDWLREDNPEAFDAAGGDHETEGFEDYQRAVAEHYATEMAKQLSDFAGVPVAIEVNRIVSPRFYNFETDRIEAWINDEALPALFAATDKGRLARLVNERHSSRSGFISFYSGDYARDWARRPVDDWDCNELETLLAAAIETARGEPVESWEDYLTELFDDAGLSLYGTAIANISVKLKNTEELTQ